MTALEQVRRLWDHVAWADAALLAQLEHPAAPPLAHREYAHVLAVEEIWLARLEGRKATVTIWPELAFTEFGALAQGNRAGYLSYLGGLTDADVTRGIGYTNSAGRSFVTPVGDILLHVALHGQYHRGKVNLLLRQAQLEPAPVDFISFVRGVPAATASVPPAR